MTSEQVRPMRSLNNTNTNAEAAPDKEKPKARDPLLAAICHDLRAPLAAVTMGANFVLTTTPDEEPNTRSRRVLQAMLRSCKQMERLVRDFGDLSEIEGNAVVLRCGVHDVGAMLEMSVEATRPLATARNVSLVIEESAAQRDGRVLLRCDRDRIMHALAHLIENAIRFAPEQSSVLINARADDDDVVICVHDSGPGLSAETSEHLYDRMWHAKRADRVGAGLGLAIARGLVEAHDGHIDVDSKAGSTTFALVVPREGSGSGSSEEAVVFP